MQTTITAEYNGKTVAGWLHRTGGKHLVILVHCHNCAGTQGRYIAMAKELERLGIDCLRFNITRGEVAPGIIEVTSVTEEYNQTKAILSQIRSKYSKVVAAGHSQGGMVCTRLADEGLVDGSVLLMSVIDVAYHITNKLPWINMSLEELRTKPYGAFTLPNGVFGYTTAFFDDFATWNSKALLARNKKPLLFVEASKEDRLKPGEMQEGFAAASGPKELFTIDDKHLFSQDNAILIARKIASWMQEQKL